MISTLNLSTLQQCILYFPWALSLILQYFKFEFYQSRMQIKVPEISPENNY